MPWSRFTYTPPGLNLLDSQTFTSSTTYTISSNAKILILEFFAAGGGGAGGGRIGNNQGISGGGGGAGGGRHLITVSTAQISGSVTVTVGAGGTAGTGGISTSVVGNAGGAGGTSRFGSVYIQGAYGGRAYSSTGDSSGFVAMAVSPSPTFQFPLLASIAARTPRPMLGAGGIIAGDYFYDFGGGMTGWATTQVSIMGNGGAGTKNYLGGGGGGSGAPMNQNAGTAQAGGSSENDPANVITAIDAANTGGGGAAGTSGSAGTAGTNKAGGGGGAASTSAIGGAGGAGASPSGGGGGGGAARNYDGGAGGSGGRGEIKLWVYG